MMRVCHLNTCPVGIATQDPELRKKFAGKPEHVVNFFRFIAEEVRELMAQLGFRTLDEMIGRVDRLDVAAGDRALEGAAASTSRRSSIEPACRPTRARRAHVRRRITASTRRSTHELIERCAGRRSSTATPVELALPIRNVNRTVGTMLGYEVTRRYGGDGPARRHDPLNFTGSAGQSFGAFLPRGITLTLEGDANDYVGKGLSGGKLDRLSAARARRSSPEENIIIGNVALYGATERRGVHPRHGRRALRGPQQRRARGRRRRRRPRLRVHDRRPRRRARPHRPQLRGRHERRHRLRARRGRATSSSAATSAWSISSRSTSRRGRRLRRELIERHVALHRQRPCGARCSTTGPTCARSSSR